MVTQGQVEREDRWTGRVPKNWAQGRGGGCMVDPGQLTEWRDGIYMVFPGELTERRGGKKEERAGEELGYRGNSG